MMISDAADGTDPAQISKLLFGHANRLAVAAAVAKAERPEHLYEKAIAARAGVPPNVVGEQLRRFARAGLLTRLASEGGDRRVFYVRHDSAYWSGVAAFAQELERRQRRAPG